MFVIACKQEWIRRPLFWKSWDGTSNQFAFRISTATTFQEIDSAERQARHLRSIEGISAVEIITV